MALGPSLLHELLPPPDPWETARRLAHLPHLLFFESAGGPPALARYSYVAADPVRWLTSRGTAGANPFERLRRELAAWPAKAASGLPPFQGGAAGLFGYDLCHWIERLPRPNRDDFEVPDLAVGVYDRVIAWDHAQNRAWIVSTGYPETDERAQRERASARLTELLGERSRVAKLPTRLNIDSDLDMGCGSHPVPGRSGVLSNFDQSGYIRSEEHTSELQSLR